LGFSKQYHRIIQTIKDPKERENHFIRNEHHLALVVLLAGTSDQDQASFSLGLWHYQKLWAKDPS